MTIPKNRLWALPSTAEALTTAEGYRHSYSDMDHILIVSPERPEGAKEVRDEHIHLLTRADCMFLMQASEEIRREQEEEFRDELLKKQDEFINRFRNGLQDLRSKEEQNGGKTENG